MSYGMSTYFLHFVICYLLQFFSSNYKLLFCNIIWFNFRYWLLINTFLLLLLFSFIDLLCLIWFFVLIILYIIFIILFYFQAKCLYNLLICNISWEKRCKEYLSIDSSNRDRIIKYLSIISTSIYNYLFSAFKISFFGICKKVVPKKRLAVLKYEWKHNRRLVTYSFPCRRILSYNAHLKVCLNCSPYSKVIFLERKS